MVEKLAKKKNQAGKNSPVSFNIKINRLLVFLFVLLLPTQLGRHFFLPFSYLSGVRIDYLAPTLYLTDILAILLIINNLKTVYLFLKQKKILFILGLLLINIFFSLSTFVSVFQWIRILEWLSLFAIFKNLAKKFKADQTAFFLLLGGFFELFLCLLQLVNKHSIQGLFYFFGERYMTLSMPGIAKASFRGIEILRPYGTFSHPNSMAGFYLLIYFFVLTNKKIKHVFLKYFLLLVSTILVFLSFSKIAILTLIFLSATYQLLMTKNKCRLCFIAKIFSLMIIGAVFISAQNDPFSLEKRITLMGNALEILIKHPLTGVGIGSYLVAQNQFPIKYSYFFLQPVHNIFLLFMAEAGIVISIFAGLTIVSWIKKNKKNIALMVILLAVFITGSFDHYWLTLQQNILLMVYLFSAL